MSLIVKIGKKGKKIVKKVLQPAEKHNLSYTRRIERIKTDRRICAMTFDDGPMDLPVSPDRFGGKSLTDVLLDTLAEFGAKGTFDVVGDTSENYPDKAGKVGSAAWGGVKYDHYPDIHQDDKGGAEHNDRLIHRILAEGHQITNHGYRHIIFGKKPFVYGARVYLGSLDKAVEDLQKLDKLMWDRYGYQITLHRPPHYVDKMQDGFTSYDVCDKMGYQYMAASFDGAGWLPSTLSDPEAALEAEVNAMVEPMRKALEKDPDFFCGQIIFQKDGYNMGKRTPVAFGLRKQLELLKEYGYQVVTVDTLLAESPFADLGRDDPLFEKLNKLQHFFDSSADLRFRCFFQFQPISNVICYIHMGKKCIILEHCVHIALIRFQGCHIFSIQKNLSGIWLFQACDDPQCGGLTAAGGADEHGELPLLNFKAQIV